jgi:hypothetical protein
MQQASFFARPMYFAEITNWPPDKLHTLRPVESSRGAQFTIHITNPADDAAIPYTDPAMALFATDTFSLSDSGNRTLRTPKSSREVHFRRAGDAGRLAGMSSLNLGAMYNDPSQMREALAWQFLGEVGIPAARHTYVKFAINGVYRGLFSLIEQVDEAFLKEQFGANNKGNLYKAGIGDVGAATLEHRVGSDGDDSGRQYFRYGNERTYSLETNETAPAINTYEDLATFVRRINATTLADRTDPFATDTFRESVEDIMNVWAFLRWAGANILIGGWDNYFATPGNYYLYNSGRLRAEDDFMGSPYFTFIPWAYENSYGIDFFGTSWQYAEILDWPGNTSRYWRDRGKSRIPLVQNVLSNHDFCQYYLDHLEYLLDTVFTPDVMAQRIGINGGGLWGRVSHAVNLESNTPDGQPFTGRQFTNDEVYRAGFKQYELQKGNAKIEGIMHYTRMRYDSARIQLDQLRRAYPRGASGAIFSEAMEPLPEQI